MLDLIARWIAMMPLRAAKSLWKRTSGLISVRCPSRDEWDVRKYPPAVVGIFDG